VLTRDALFDGDLLLYQAKGGYRFSMDAVLLAGMTRVQATDRVVDLGTGCGVVPLILAHRERGCVWVGIEIQPDLAELARRNVAANGWDTRIHILEMDFREVSGHFGPGAFDLVVSNPPYRRLTSGRINPNPQRAVARHELMASLEDVCAAASFLLSDGGRMALVYPASRLAHLMVVIYRHGFAPKRLTCIHSRQQSPATLIHLECRKGGGEELQVEPPLYVYQADGQLSETVRKLYQDENPINAGRS
jgi:tRNA1Val (adenine37-N6)-methyltransferase